MNASEGERCAKTKEFKEMLEARIPVEVILWDERLSTVAAHDVMTLTNVRGSERKEYVDEIAAMLILQGYLDYLHNQKEIKETI